MLTREQVRAFYDRFGALQDRQGFYEDVATHNLIEHANFEQASSVFEFGCGTGRFAEDLLSHHLAETAGYTGCDLSTTMVGIARGRLARFSARAQVQLTDGTFPLAAPDAAFDRFVSNYVLDLLPSDDIDQLLAEAHRVLRPDGHICILSLTHGVTPVSRLVSSAWAGLHRLRPALVGGCRPLELLDFLDERHWRIDYRNVVTGFGIPTEVVVGRKHF